MGLKAQKSAADRFDIKKTTYVLKDIYKSVIKNSYSK